MPAERRLSVLDGDRTREVTLIGTVTVGRSPDCEISSADPRLSRAHAAFDVVGDDVVVRDLDSRNGTLVNGVRVTEHRLSDADRVEIGPFVLQLVAVAPAKVERPPLPTGHDDAATVLLQRASRDAEAVAEIAPVASPDTSTEATRLLNRPSPAADATPPPLAPPTQPAAGAAAPAAAVSASSPAPAPDVVPVVAAGKAGHRPPPSSLGFGNTLLLWIVPVVLLSFLSGLLPVFTQPDERGPLLHAHYQALAAGGVDLVKASHEPEMPLDAVTTALRRQVGVTAARLVGADGRVLAPLDQAGTTMPLPEVNAEGVMISTSANGTVDISAAARAADGRPITLLLTVDSQRILPAASASPLGVVLLLVSLASAWVVARSLTRITDARLSRLGEDVELMTTRQVSEGHDTFGLPGSRRILDAVLFALSAAGRTAGDAARPDAHAGRDAANSAPSASIVADTAFRIVSVEGASQLLLGVGPQSAVGSHIIEALADQAVADEVMRLLTAATPERPVSGEVTSRDGGVRLAVDVARGAGAAPITIRFKRV